MILSFNVFRKPIFPSMVFETPERSFTGRLKFRHKKFWTDPHAEIVRNYPMCDEPIEKWKSFEHWQRMLSNKLNALKFAEMHGCNVPYVYWVGKDPDQIRFESLPDQYVIKPTIGHSCQLVFLMNKGYNMLDKRPYTINELITIMKNALAVNPHMEFLIEEFVRSEAGEYCIPLDYKVHTFNGKIARIEVINRIGAGQGTDTLFDENWQHVPNIGTKYKSGIYYNQPKCLSQILCYARALSKAYEIYVRIDFYATDKGAVFGEFTPTPGIGTGFTKKADQLFTQYWDQYCPGKI